MSTPSGSGTLLLILIQVASRALTFIGNQFLLRFLSPDLLGISVQLELVSVTSLYFARDSLRVALQRAPPSPPRGDKGTEKDAHSGRQTQTVVNLSYLAVTLGLFIATAFGWSYLRSAPDEVLQSPYFDISFRIYALATLAELAAEPAFIVIQQRALYGQRARAETAAAMARCIAACATAVVGNAKGFSPSILPFAVGQASYAVVLFSLYFLPIIYEANKDHFNLTPRRISLLVEKKTSARNSKPVSNSCQSSYYLSLFHLPSVQLAATMYMQSIFKLILTQGDALILSFLSSLSDQGAFALASNYGGLVARLILQPVEESSRNIFGRLLSSSSSTASSTASPDQTSKPPTPNKLQALNHLKTTLHIYLIISLPLVALAPPLLPFLTPYLLSPTWRTNATTSLLALYIYYLPLTAVNGILDSFVTSVATPAQLRTQSLWMLVFTGIYGVAAWISVSRLGLGAKGLVAANMVNMFVRSAWGWWFVRTWAQKEVEGDAGGKVLSKALPKVSSVLVTGMVAGVIHVFVDNKPNGTTLVEMVGVVAASGVVLGSTILYSEQEFLQEILSMIAPRRYTSRSSPSSG